MVKGGGAGHGAGRFALPDRRPRHRALRLPFPRSAGLHTLPVLRVPHLHRCAQRPAVLAAGWPCGPWHLDLCVLPWVLHPVLRSDVLPEGAAIQTEQLRNPAASNHTLRGSFLFAAVKQKMKMKEIYLRIFHFESITKISQRMPLAEFSVSANKIGFPANEAS